MSRPLPRTPHPLRSDRKTSGKIALNLRRNKEQDHTALLDAAARDFRWEDCSEQWWNPESFSLLYNTPLWHQSTDTQRLRLNQLYWVAYYSQIVSAEVATIYFNQTSAAGLYGLDDFRQVCDMLDLESSQERAHIHAFQTVGEATEAALLGERLFTRGMQGPFGETMIFPDSSRLRRRWKSLQLRSFGLLSSGNAFIACQYFTVRGLRTLNGKLVQGELSNFHAHASDADTQGVPSKISYFHFMDESYHFNSSTLLGKEVVQSLPTPTRFESTIANLGVLGTQRDHSNVSVTVRGLFWHEPSTFQAVYKLLRGPIFELDHEGALRMMRACYAEENEAVHEAFALHRTATDSYALYLDGLTHLWARNRDVSLMRAASMERYLKQNQAALECFVPEEWGSV